MAAMLGEAMALPFSKAQICIQVTGTESSILGACPTPYSYGLQTFTSPALKVPQLSIWGLNEKEKNNLHKPSLPAYLVELLNSVQVNMQAVI